MLCPFHVSQITCICSEPLCPAYGPRDRLKYFDARAAARPFPQARLHASMRPRSPPDRALALAQVRGHYATARLACRISRRQQRHCRTARARDGPPLPFKNSVICDSLVRQDVEPRPRALRILANRRICNPSAVLDQLHGGQLELILSKHFYEHEMSLL